MRTHAGPQTLLHPSIMLLPPHAVKAVPKAFAPAQLEPLLVAVPALEEEPLGACFTRQGPYASRYTPLPMRNIYVAHLHSGS